MKEIADFALNILGVYDIAPASCEDHPVWSQIAQWACQNLKVLCDNIMPGIGLNSKMDTAFDDLSKLATHYPSGASANCFLKYAQLISMSAQKQFPKFDYGFFGNIQHYGTYNVPLWDVTKMKAKVVLIGGMSDDLGTTQDIDNLNALLPVDTTKLYWMKDWDHGTFMMARDPSRLFKIFDDEI